VTEPLPFDHNCTIFNFKVLAFNKVECYCVICGRFVLEIEINPEDFGIKPKKVYPKFDQAQYHPVNLAMWV
jgi:hypothetical protein